MSRPARSGARAARAALLSPEALGHLAAAMVHEVRNRLNPMSIHVDLLRSRVRELATLKPETGPAALRSVEIVAAEIERLDRILTAYLEYAGPPEGATTETDVHALLGAVADRASAAARRRGVRVAVEGSSLGRFPLDSAALRLALDALVDFAVESSPRGATVSLRARREEENLVIEVEDRGEPFTTEDLTRAFQIGAVTRRGRPGSGLTVAKQAVRAHAGATMSLLSAAPEPGCTARIELPLD